MIGRISWSETGRTWKEPVEPITPAVYAAVKDTSSHPLHAEQAMPDVASALLRIFT